MRVRTRPCRMCACARSRSAHTRLQRCPVRSLLPSASRHTQHFRALWGVGAWTSPATTCQPVCTPPGRKRAPAPRRRRLAHQGTMHPMCSTARAPGARAAGLSVPPRGTWHTRARSHAPPRPRAGTSGDVSSPPNPSTQLLANPMSTLSTPCTVNALTPYACVPFAWLAIILSHRRWQPAAPHWPPHWPLSACALWRLPPRPPPCRTCART